VPKPSLGDRLDRLQRFLPQHLADKILANRGRLEGERKLVTVLFADIAGYTALSERIEEEALFSLMDELYELFIHEVHRYEGTVNELTGDGIIAFFGAPLAVEQAPVRAVRAALALQQAAARYSSRLEHERGCRLQVRVGINTGPVIVGIVGNNLRMDYKAVGNTVNLAARMEQGAVPGTVQITAQTYRLVSGYFDCEDLELISIKGVAEPVQIYRVISECGVQARIDVARERGFTQLVGRERELAQLRHCFELVKAGSGQAISIIGEAGLGKSRLLYECRQMLDNEDLTWLEGRCSPDDTSVAYLPIINVLKRTFRIGANDSDEDIVAKVHYALAALEIDRESTAPYVLHLLAPGLHNGLPTSLPPEVVKHRLFEALRLLMLAEAARRPLVLTIEDAHWGDQTTTDEMVQLAEAIGDSEIVIDAHSWRLVCLLELGHIQAIDDAIEARVRVDAELQMPAYHSTTTGSQAMRALLEGRFAESERLALQAHTIGQRVQSGNAAGSFGVQMFTLCRERGSLKELEPVIRSFVQQHSAASAWRPGLAVIYSELGREQEARTEFEYLAQHDFMNLTHNSLWVGSIAYLTEVCAFLGDAHHAATLYQLLLPYAGRTVVVGGGVVCYGAASRYLGILATIMQRWDEAEQHFHDALAMNARMGARPWLAHTQHAYAVMLLSRKQPGDREQALSLLDEALGTARELGMRVLEERITTQIQHMQTPPDVDLVYPDDLSQREQEVLHLLAAGKSNREIAEALYISLNTVASHVRNILTKTGTTNRTEAAAYAVRHGLRHG
jgi:class 3 adenylate cyclase/DNA-binding NarL/FixJ family response regulator